MPLEVDANVVAPYMALWTTRWPIAADPLLREELPPWSLVTFVIPYSRADLLSRIVTPRF